MLLLYISFKNKGFLFLISLPLFQVSWHIDIDSVNKNTKFGYYLSLIRFFVRNEKVSENSSNDLINSFNDIHNIATHPIGNSNEMIVRIMNLLIKLNQMNLLFCRNYFWMKHIKMKVHEHLFKYQSLQEEWIWSGSIMIQ